MQYLIKPDRVELDESPPPLPLSFAPTVEDHPPPERKEPEKVEPPDLPPVRRPELAVLDSETSWDGPLVPETSGAKPGVVQGDTDGMPLPIMMVAPDYPVRAARRGIEGYVVLEFTISASGQVVNARVVEAVPPGVFDRAALRAVQRYKYKPRVTGGKALATQGVLHRISFDMTRD